MFGLDQTADVYTPNGTDGDFTNLAKADLVCRLANIQVGPAGVGGERENIGLNRRLLWQEDYMMPDDAQVDVDGQRWNVLVGTFAPIRGVDSGVVYRRCEVTMVVS